MAGIQISGLLSGQAFDWKSVVDQLIAADSIPVTTLQTEKTTNTTKITALGDINTSLQALQDSVQSLRATDVFTSRAVSSDNPNTSWRSTSSSGAPVGSYKIAVQQLATSAQVAGAPDIGGGIAASTDVSGVTLANLNTASAVTAGVFTVGGKQITIALTDSLQDVFDKISTATSGTVTGAYDNTTDTVTLSQSSGELVLGAANDTSNFLQVFKLNNTGLNTTTSSSALGTLKYTSPLISSGLRAGITAVDGSGNGSFSINNVAITYNVNTDSLAGVISRINASSAGVTASYDAASDRMILTNKLTGDAGITVSEPSGGLVDAVGLSTAATFTHGKNAMYTVNGGPTIVSASNTLGSASHGITGLSVTVNSATTETVTVASDTGTMQSALQDLLDKFNAVQDDIDAKTKITIGGGSATPSVLSDNHEVQGWAQQLQDLVFNQVTGITGSITHLDDLGIDFDGTSGHLVIKNQAKLADALDNHPDDVESFFISGSNGLVPQLYGTLTNLSSSDLSQQDSINKANTDLDTQIATLQSKLDDERTTLTNSFIAMLDAQSAAQSQNQALTNQFFNNNSSCWVARAVYGASDGRWVLFRFWLLYRAPVWFRALYLRHGQRIAPWIAARPRVRSVLRRWMDARIGSLCRP